MSIEKLSIPIDYETKKATSVFYATDKITKTLVRTCKQITCKQETHYTKRTFTMSLNIYNGLENEKFLPEKLLLNAPFVEKSKTLFVRGYIVLVDYLKHYRLI